MKIVSLCGQGETRRYARFYRDEPAVTVKGGLSFQIIPLKEDRDLIDRLIEDHPDFRSLWSGAWSELDGLADATKRRREVQNIQRSHFELSRDTAA